MNVNHPYDKVKDEQMKIFLFLPYFLGGAVENMGKEIPALDLSKDKFSEECGIFGVASSEDDAAHLTFFGIHALQHRGQESAGIAVVQDGEIVVHKAAGLVMDVFNEEKLNDLKSPTAIGHVQYFKPPSGQLVNTQPLLIKTFRGAIALAYNGNLLNSQKLRWQLEKEGSIFHSVLDTEVIAHLIARSGEDDFEAALIKSLRKVQGAYALITLKDGKIYGVRDPHGFRPLVLGQINDDYALASESCAFHIIGGRPIREIEPGEMVILEEGKLRSRFFTEPQEKRFCVFEYIYFARPDSTFGCLNVHEARKAMGKQLAKEYDVKGDIVIPVPDSGISAGQGFAQEAGLPFEMGMIKNKYVGRTFFLPRQSLRDLQVKMKLSLVNELIKDKRVILIDDSIVRGTTSQLIVKLVREAGAKEVHLGVSSPPVIDSCYYGLDTTNRKELIASKSDVDAIARHIGVDSLQYLSIDGLRLALAGDDQFCDACFSGNYPLGGDSLAINEEGKSR